MRTKKKSDILLKKTTLEIFCFITAIFIGLTNNFAQTQIGNDIPGNLTAQLSGHSVSMPNSTTVAIGSNSLNGAVASRIRIYNLIGNDWEQKGGDIQGESTQEGLGETSMPDVNTFAFGAQYNNNNGSYSGHVRVYSWNGSDWEQKGNSLDGDAELDFSGQSVIMPDANTLAIGAPGNPPSQQKPGYVAIHSWNGASWEQKGLNLSGENLGDGFGTSVRMPDSNTIAIGAPFNDDNGLDTGKVRVYSWNGNEWLQKGSDLVGTVEEDRFGYAVSMPDNNTLAVGAPYSDENGVNSGQVNIYSWNGTDWEQKGMSIIGDSESGFGWSLSMPNDNVIAIGAPFNFGYTRLYSWNGNDWNQAGVDIVGETQTDNLGTSVSMPDAQTLAVGAPSSYLYENLSGYVKVLDFSGLSLNEVEQPGFSIEAFPNPFKDYLTLKTQSPIKSVRVYSLLGQIVFEESNFNEGTLNINLSTLSTGKYLVNIQTNDGSFSKKIIKE
ncbi:MAG: T9SS type A sorting domain-containing protein [Flavobacteriaceae bacterium]